MHLKEAIKNVANVPGKYNITGGRINGDVNVSGQLGVAGNLKTSKYLQVGAWENYGTGTLNLWFNNRDGAGELTSQELKNIKLGNNYVYHTGHKPSPSDIGAAASSHGHENYISGSGSHGTTTVGDANDIWKSGFYDLDRGANVPFGEWIWLLNVAHSHNAPGYKYGFQIAAQNGASNFAMRTTNVHGAGDWHTLWHSGNFDPNSKANNHDHPYIPTSASCNKNWNWNGQSGQPNWLWGGNDGTNMYVYNPSNFRVSYADSAGHSGNSDRIGGKNIFVQQSQPSPGATGDIWISW